jgi:tetratricopeptide (TPR) repeat protein
VIDRSELNIIMNLNTFADLCQVQGKYVEAEKHYIRALNMYRALPEAKKNDLNLATLLNNLGQHYDAIGDYEEAKTFYEEALNIRRQAQGVPIADFVISLNNLAGIYHKWGDYAEAEAFYQEACAQRLDAKTLEATRCQADRVRLMMDRSGDGTGYDKAKIAYQHSLHVSKELLGDDSPYVAIRLNNLAELYRTRREYAQAKPLYQEAQAIYVRRSWAAYPDYANVIGNYAVLLQDLEEYPDANQHYKKALKLYEQLNLYKHQNGKNYYKVADVLSNYARLAYVLQDYEVALARYQEALAIYEQHISRGYERVFAVLNTYADISSLLKRDTEKVNAYVKGFYEKALCVYRKELGDQHREVENILKQYIQFLRSAGLYIDAREQALVLDKKC